MPAVYVNFVCRLRQSLYKVAPRYELHLDANGLIARVLTAVLVSKLLGHMLSQAYLKGVFKFKLSFCATFLSNAMSCVDQSRIIS